MSATSSTPPAGAASPAPSYLLSQWGVSAVSKAPTGQPSEAWAR
jgi:hypothetical protein